LHKEFAPMPSLSNLSEVLVPVEQQIELEPEVENAGVEVVATAPQMSQQEKNAGVDHAKETKAFEKEPTSQVQFPMTQAQALQMTKGNILTKDTSNPMLWLAM